MFRFTSDHVYWHAQFSDDSTMFWTQMERTISVYLTATGQKITTFDNVANGAFSPDGKLFVTNHSTNEAAGIARVWRLGTREPISTLQQVPAGSWMWFTNDGQRIGGSGDKSLRIWKLNGREAAVHIPDSEGIDDDALRTFTIGRTAFWLWDATTGQRLAYLRGHDEEIMCVQFSPTNEHIVSYDRKNVVVWERRRPESIFGVFFLPEFWLTIAFASAFIWSCFRDRTYG
jgi:WD40 repeat protein